MHRNEFIKYIEDLNAEDVLEESRTANKFYCKAVKEPSG